jgi:Domain of unknown function (DUF4160)
VCPFLRRSPPRHEIFLQSTIGSPLALGPLERGQILPYVEGDRGSADAGDQAVWQLQAPAVLPGQNPPHVHIKGADFAARIRISNGDLIAGEAPNKVLKRARRWVEGHRAELLAMWNEFQR